MSICRGPKNKTTSMSICRGPKNQNLTADVFNDNTVTEAVRGGFGVAIEFGAGSTDSGVDPNTEIQNNCQYGEMVTALKSKICEPEFSFSYTDRIRRVPDHLRKVNEQAYSPMVVSVGPIHHLDKNLQSMEKFKVGYLKFVLANAEVNLVDLVIAIRKMEGQIYCCYTEFERSMDVDDFFNVILVDAIFVLEFMHRKVERCVVEDDYLIVDQMEFIVRDLLLLENQLPFFVLELLFSRIDRYKSKSTLLDLLFAFLERFNVQGMPFYHVKIGHFVDLIRRFQLPPPSDPVRGSEFLPERVTGSEMITLMHSATQLHGAGVKFKVSPSKCLLDISFDLRSGVLELPCLEINEMTEALVRNVMASEQYCFRQKTYVRDYYLFLDRLVNTTKDVDLLCDKGIIHNYLGDNDAVTSLVNKLNVHVIWSGVHPIHNRIFRDLNCFYEARWPKWWATLRRQHFSTPWRIASTIAAVVLLVFTFVQTVCSIIQIVPIV